MTVTHRYQCDHCEHAEVAWGPLPPAGWVRVEQGLGSGSTMGTRALPPEIDLLIQDRTFCSVGHLAAWIALNPPQPRPPRKEEA